MANAVSNDNIQCPLCSSSAHALDYTRSHVGKTWGIALCDECGLYFTCPPPAEENLTEFYSGDYHQEIRGDAHAEFALEKKYRRYVALLKRHLDTGKVLDIGCSSGLLVRMLLDAGYQAEGIEMDRQTASWGQEKYGITIHITDLKHCPIAEGTLDGALMMDVLEHTQHPLNFLIQVNRLIRPGGIVMISFPDIRSLESRYWYAMSLLLRRHWLWHTCHVPLHVWEFTEPTAKAVFEKAGFAVEELRRSQPELERFNSIPLELMRLPVRFLSLGPFERRLGTQMEFILRKTHEQG